MSCHTDFDSPIWTSTQRGTHSETRWQWHHPATFCTATKPTWEGDKFAAVLAQFFNWCVGWLFCQALSSTCGCQNPTG